MQFRRAGPKFQHFAGDHDAPLRRRLRQSCNHAVQRLGIGIVAIVDEDCAAHFAHLAALVAGAERGQTRHRVARD